MDTMYRLLYQQYLNLQSLATRLQDGTRMGLYFAWMAELRTLCRPLPRRLVFGGPMQRLMMVNLFAARRMDRFRWVRMTADGVGRDGGRDPRRDLGNSIRRLRYAELEWDRLQKTRYWPLVLDWLMPYAILALLPAVGAQKRPIHRISWYLWMEVMKMLSGKAW